MKKRLISIVLSVALLCALSLPASANPSSWANDEVARALELGFVPTDLQSDYQSDMTRAEFAEIAISFLAVEYGYTQSLILGEGYGRNDLVENFLTDYCDVMTDRDGEAFVLTDYNADTKDTSYRWWTAFSTQEQFTDLGTLDSDGVGFVNAAYALGIVNGTSSETFNPDGAITRQEAATMLARTYYCYAQIATTTAATTYADQSDVADWAQDSVALMTQFGIMSGIGENTFSPTGTYTREQCIVTFMRLYDSAPEGLAQGTMSPLFTYDEQMDRMMTLGDYGTTLLHRTYADDFTLIYVSYYTTGMSTGSAFRMVYKDGSFQAIDMVQGYSSIFTLDDTAQYLNYININRSSGALNLTTGEITSGWK